MNCYWSCDSTSRCVDSYSAVEIVGDSRNDEDNYKGSEEPIDEELDEWKLEDVEPDVDVELRVFDSEIFPVSEENPILPATSCSYAKEKSE